MVAHTGFLVFARRIEPAEDPRGVELSKEVGASNVEPKQLDTDNTEKAEVL
jgi:hypothetical protein